MPLAIELMDVADVARIIKLPLKQWPGKCYGVSSDILKHGLVEGTLRYGHWRGPVDRASMFFCRAALGFVQHGWIELPGGKRVCDPTRWVFEHYCPYIYVGDATFYDVGGNQFRETVWPAAPPSPDPSVDRRTIDLSRPVLKVVNTLLGYHPTYDQGYDMGQLFWLANRPPAAFFGRARFVYRALAKAGLRALIPIDNWYLECEG